MATYVLQNTVHYVSTGTGVKTLQPGKVIDDRLYNIAALRGAGAILEPTPESSTWGPPGAQVISDRDILKTKDGAAHIISTIEIPDHANTKLDFSVQGFAADGSAADWNLSVGYVSNGAGPVIMGTLTSVDPRGTNAGTPPATWQLPVLGIDGQNVTISVQDTGGSQAIDWFCVWQITVNGRMP